MPYILIRNGKLWDGENFINADLLIDKGRIAQISGTIQTNADFIYDAMGKIVSAGLVDMHVHMQGVSPNLFGVNAEMSCIPFGVTAAADACAVLEDGRDISQSLVKNVLFAGTAIINDCASFSQTKKIISKYGDRVIGLKAFFDKESGQVRSITPLREIVEFAQERNLKVMVHSSGAPTVMSEAVEVLRAGDILTHAYHGGENSVRDDGFACLKRAKEKGVIIDIGFAGNVHADFSILREGIENGIKPNTISTDITRCSAYKRGGRYGMTACMTMARLLGMTEEEVLKAVTSAPAKALGKQDEWGHLRVGRQADISVLEWGHETLALTDKYGNSVKSKLGYKNILTIVNGEVVYRK